MTQVGQFRVKDKNVCVVLRIGQDKTVYTLEALEGKTSLGRRDLTYYEYFTQSGVFLSFKFKRELEELTRVVEEQLAK
jgi:hypothetical protein